MTDRTFLEVIAAAAGPDWRVTRPESDEPWIEVSPEDARLPSQGWKLHVSATVDDSIAVLERALPVLIYHRAAFKVVASPELLDTLNAGEAGVGQIGKFIAVYPADEEAAVRVGVALDRVTRGLRGPPVPSDRPLNQGSLIHYRYGSFEDRMAVDPWGRPVPVIIEPGGDPVPDARQDTYVRPPWAKDPFVAAGVTKKRAREAIAGRFAVTSTLHRSPRGAVHLAVDFDRVEACVLKQAWRNAAVGPDGRDASDHLRWEASVLERLAPDPRFPALITLVEHEGDLFLAMEHVSGPTISGWVGDARDRSAFVPPGQVVDWGIQLAEALAAIHENGLAYRDLTSTNVVIAERLRLVDFEHAAELGSPDAPPGGTAGYASPEQAAGKPPAVADDVYALGAILYLLCTGAEPPEAPDPFALLDRPIRLINPSIDETLADVVARCLHPDPDSHYPSAASVVAALAGATARAPALQSPTEQTSGAQTLARGAAEAVRDLLEGHPAGSGRAAAVLGLAELEGALGDHRHVETLRRVATELAAEAAEITGGLLSGEGLVVAALFASARTLDDRALARAAAERAARLRSNPPAGPDLTTGLAGQLRVHLLAFRETGDPRFRDAALEVGDRLVTVAEDGPRWPLPEFAGTPGPVHMGWAHGLAGIADALLDLQTTLEESGAGDTVEAAVRRLEATALPGLNDDSGRVWPDVEGGPPGGTSLWRGAAGVTRFLLRAAAAGVPGAEGLTDRGLRTVAGGGRWAGPTLGLGLAGSITVLLDAAAADPRWHTEAASHVRLLEAFHDRSEWRGLLEPTDLAVGLPGIAIVLARLVTGRPDPLAVPLVGLEDRGPRWSARTTKG